MYTTMVRMNNNNNNNNNNKEVHMAKKVNVKNFEKVLDNIKTLFNNSSKEDKVFMCNDLNEMLDMQRDNDFFGTEGELDPRGDNRN